MRFLGHNKTQHRPEAADPPLLGHGVQLLRSVQLGLLQHTRGSSCLVAPVSPPCSIPISPGVPEQQELASMCSSRSQESGMCCSSLGWLWEKQKDLEGWILGLCLEPEESWAPVPVPWAVPARPSLQDQLFFLGKHTNPVLKTRFPRPNSQDGPTAPRKRSREDAARNLGTQIPKRAPEKRQILPCPALPCLQLGPPGDLPCSQNPRGGEAAGKGSLRGTRTHEGSLPTDPGTLRSQPVPRGTPLSAGRERRTIGPSPPLFPTKDKAGLWHSPAP